MANSLNNRFRHVDDLKSASLDPPHEGGEAMIIKYSPRRFTHLTIHEKNRPCRFLRIFLISLNCIWSNIHG